jgi:hypothetical protein
VASRIESMTDFVVTLYSVKSFKSRSITIFLPLFTIKTLLQHMYILWLEHKYYTIPHRDSTAPSTRLMATAPLNGYSEMDTNSCICEVLTDKQHYRNESQSGHFNTNTYIGMVSGLNHTNCKRSKHENNRCVIW